MRQFDINQRGISGLVHCAAPNIIALSFNELIVFTISNQPGSSSSWGLHPQTRPLPFRIITMLT